VLDTNTYPTGVRIPPAQQKAIPLQRYAFHGEWNYIIHSGPISESVRSKEILHGSTRYYLIKPLVSPARPRNPGSKTGG
jgi:hypothetical protein